MSLHGAPIASLRNEPKQRCFLCSSGPICSGGVDPMAFVIRHSTFVIRHSQRPQAFGECHNVSLNANLNTKKVAKRTQIKSVLQRKKSYFHLAPPTTATFPGPGGGLRAARMGLTCEHECRYLPPALQDRLRWRTVHPHYPRGRPLDRRPCGSVFSGASNLRGRWFL
jgi:hypothetical protein